jgi:hypothetical protein
MAARWFPPQGWANLTSGVGESVGETSPTLAWRVAAAWWLAVCLVPAFVDRSMSVSAVLIGCVLFALWRRRYRDLTLLVQAWPFFFFLAWFHLLDTPGHLLGSTGITREGIDSFLVHAGRLGVFLLAGRNLFRVLPWGSFLSASPWARATSMALPVLPRLFQAATAAARESWASRRDPDSPSFPERLLSRLAEG